MKKLLLIPFLCALFSVAQAAETTAPLKINFTDLQGKVAPYKDPFENLTEDQLYNLSIHARILAWQEAAPEQVTEAMIEESAKAKAFLDGYYSAGNYDQFTEGMKGSLLKRSINASN